MDTSLTKLNAINTTNAKMDTPRSICAPTDWSLTKKERLLHIASLLTKWTVRLDPNYVSNHLKTWVRKSCLNFIQKKKNSVPKEMLDIRAFQILFGSEPAKETEECPRRNGLFPDKDDCRSFWNCVDGKGTKSSCPQSLVFSTRRGTCDWPKNVDDCELEAEEKSKDSECTRRFGTFPDKKDCRAFWTCVDGNGRRSVCPDGLGFNPKRGSCDWADSIENCNLEDYYDFKCPEDLDIIHGDHVYYPFPGDCRKHFACIKGNGKKALLRLLTCDVGLVYDADGERCTVPEKVQGCEDYYSKSASTTKVPKQRQNRKEAEPSS